MKSVSATELNKYIKVAHGYAVNFCHGRYDNDILAVARLGLCVALDTFRDDCNFDAWLRVCIRRELVDYIRNKIGRWGTLDLVEFYDNDIRTSRDGLENRLIAKDIMHKFTNSLSRTQKRRLLMRIKDELSNVEIAKIDGVSKQAVDITFHKINNKAKRFLSDKPVRCGVW